MHVYKQYLGNNIFSVFLSPAVTSSSYLVTRMKKRQDGIRFWCAMMRSRGGGANLCVWFNLYMSGGLFMSVCYFLACLFLSVCLSVCLCVMMNCLWEEQGSLGRDCCSHFLPKLATSHSSHSHQGARSLNLILFYTHHALSCTG